MKTFLPIFFLVLSLISKAQTTRTWTGAIDADWNKPGNWNTGVPDSLDGASIPNVTNYPILSSNVRIASINVQSGAQVDFSGYTLTVSTGTATLNSCTLTNGILNTKNINTTNSNVGVVVYCEGGTTTLKQSTFFEKVNITHTSAANSTSYDNTFKKTVTILNTGQYYTSGSSGNPDIYEDSLIVVCNGGGVTLDNGVARGYCKLLRNAGAYIHALDFTFKDRIALGSTVHYTTASGMVAIRFGSSAVFDSTAVLEIAPEGFLGSELVFQNQINIPVNLVLTGNGVFSPRSGAVFNKPVNVSTASLGLQNTTFNDSCNIVTTGSSTHSSIGPIVCNSYTRITNIGSGSAYLEGHPNDAYNGPLHLINSGSGQIMLGRTGNTFINNDAFLTVSSGAIHLGTDNGGQANFNKNVYSQISGGSISFHKAEINTGYKLYIPTFSSGALTLKRLKYNDPDSLIITGAGSITLGPNTEMYATLKVVTANITIKGGKYYEDVYLEKTGNSGNQGTGSAIFYKNLHIKNSGVAQMDLIYGGTAPNTYYGNVKLECVTGQTIYPGYQSVHNIYGNLEHAGDYMPSYVNSRWVFKGDTNQYIRGNLNGYNLFSVTIDKPGGKLLSEKTFYIGGNLLLNKGILTPLVDNVTFGDRASVSGGSDSSYVEGLLKKTFHPSATTPNTFTFPLGVNGKFGPVAITNPAYYGTYTAEFFDEDPDSLYPRNQKQSSLDFINRCGYWKIDRAGSPTPKVTLLWNNNPCYSTIPSEAKVATWKNNQWEDLGNGANSGTSAVGSVQTTSGVSTWGTVFTLAGPCTLEAELKANADTLFEGHPIYFTASPANQLNYKFYKNGALVQDGSSNVYTPSSIASGDSIRVIVRNLDLCTNAVSKIVTIYANPPYFRTASSGNWNDAASWQASLDSVNWRSSNAWPGEGALGLEVKTGHTVSLPSDLHQLTLKANARFSGGLAYATGSNTRIVLTGNNHQQFTSNDTLRLKRLVLKKDKAARQVILSAPVTISDSLVFIKGRIASTNLKPLVFTNGSVAFGANDSSYASGAVAKKGIEAFDFPIGANGKLATLSISVPETNSTFSASFFDSDPDFYYPRFEHNIEGAYVYSCNYWTVSRLSGTANPNVKLSWNETPCIDVEPSQTKVATWVNNQWMDLGNGAFSGTTVSGSVQTEGGVDSWGTAFSIAKSCSLNLELSSNLDPGNPEASGALVASPEGMEIYSFTVNNTDVQIGASPTFEYDPFGEDYNLKIGIRDERYCTARGEFEIKALGIPFEGFDCKFSYSSGVLMCGSQVTADLLIPADITSIVLTFPNTFRVLSSSNLNQVVPHSFNALPVALPALFNVPIPRGALSICTLNVSPGTGRVVLEFLGCSQNDGFDPNFNFLVFDCNGVHVNPSTLIESEATANLLPGPGMLINSGVAHLSMSGTAPAIGINSQNILIEGEPNDGYCREFTVEINSLDVHRFQLNINQETDATHNSLHLISNSAGVSNLELAGDVALPFTINLAQIPPSYIQQTGTTRILRFIQCGTLLCQDVDIQLQTVISATITCDGCPGQSISATPLLLNVSASQEPGFAIARTLTLNGVNTDASCAGEYFYDIHVTVSNSTANLQSIQIPLDTRSFQITGLGIGTNPGNLVSIPLNGLQITGNGTANSMLNVPVTTLFPLLDPWPGFVGNFGGQSGAWFDNFTGPVQLLVRVHLNYNCSAGTECVSRPTILNSREVVVIKYLNTCFQLGTHREFSAEEISSPQIIRATTDGGVTNQPAILVVGINNPQPVNFRYFINIPNQPDLFNLAGTDINCSNINYFAVLRARASTPTYNLPPITNLFVNSQLTNPAGPNQTTIPLGANAGPVEVSFSLLIDCPDPVLTEGDIVFDLQLQAVCDDCPSAQCVKNIGCSESSSIHVHCPGLCISPVGTTLDFQIERTTYGWANETDYPLTPILNRGHFNSRTEELRKFYPHDLLEVVANGSISPSSVQHNALVFQIGIEVRPTIPSNVRPLSLVTLHDYEATFTSGSISRTIRFSDFPRTLDNTPPRQTLAGDAFPKDFFEISWSSDDLFSKEININSQTWEIHLTLTLRAAPAPQNFTGGRINTSFRCQFMARPGIDDVPFSSCDPPRENLTFLYPRVEFNQQSDNNAGSISFNDGVVFTAPEQLSWCSFYHAIGVRHRGGIADGANDFPLEFRPLTDWGTTIQFPSETDQVRGLFGLFGAVGLNNGIFTNSNAGIPLLPAREKGQITTRWQGMALRIDKQCPASRDQFTPAFQINRFAYVHNEHDMTPLPPQLQPGAINAPGRNTNGEWCTSMIQFEDESTHFIPNGTSSHSFTIAPPPAGRGLPMALRVWVDEGIPVNVDNVSFGTLQPGISSTGWFLLADGVDGDNGETVTFNITVNECYSEVFQVFIEWHVFCSEEQLAGFAANPNNAPGCMYCIAGSLFQRGVMETITQTNSFSSDGCHLIWTLDVPNPVGQPALTSSNLYLNTVTGLVLDNFQVISICPANMSPVNAGVTTNVVLIDDTSPSLEYVEHTLQASNISIPPGCTLRYVFRFRLSGPTCESLTNPFNGVSLELDNPCDPPVSEFPLQINDAFLQHALSDIYNTDHCCLSIPPAVVKHVCCGETTGSISFTNSTGHTLTIRLFQNNIGTTLAEYFPNSTATFLNLTPGDYTLVIQDMTNGAIYEQHITLENRCFSLEITPEAPSEICLGTNLTLTAASYPTTPPWEGGSYTYEWSSAANPDLGENADLTVSPAVNITYNVEVSNGSCTATDSRDVVVKALPVVSIWEGESVTACPNQSVTLSIPILIGNTYQWNTGSTSPQIVVDESGTYTVVATGSNGCTSQDAIEVDISNDYCPCLCSEQEEEVAPIVVHNVHTGAQLIDYLENNTLPYKCIKLMNDVVNNTDLRLDDYEIFFAPGKSLINPSGYYLQLNRSELKGCDAQWKGVENSGKMSMKSVEIKDAQYAVTLNRNLWVIPGQMSLQAPSTALYSVSFSNNFIGLTNGGFRFLPHVLDMKDCHFTGGNLIADYPGQSPSTNPLGGLAGIRIHDGFMLDITSQMAEFDNLYNAIISHNSVLKITDVKFRNSGLDRNWYDCAYSPNLGTQPCGYNSLISYVNATRGSAINAYNSTVTVNGNFTDNEDYVMFDGCNNAISAHNSTLTVEGVRMKGNTNNRLHRGIYASQLLRGSGTVNIQNNRIYTSKAGIHVSWMGHGNHHIQHNSVFIDDNLDASDFSSLRFGIWITRSAGEGYSYITHNGVQNRSEVQFIGIGGSNKTNRNKFAFNQNNVFMASNASGSGFRFENCNRYLQVGANHSMTDPDFPEFNQTSPAFSYDFRLSPAAEIAQNCAEGTHTGYRFADASSQLLFARNHAGTHQPGTGFSLFIAENGVIGEQDNRWNSFQYSGNNVIAKDESGATGANRFTVQTNTASPYDNQSYYPWHDPAEPDCRIDQFFRCMDIDPDHSGPTPVDCSSFSEPQPMAPVDNQLQGYALADALARETISFPRYNDASVSKLRRQIVQQLRDSLLVLPDTGIFVSFKDSLFGSNEDLLNRVEAYQHFDKNDTLRYVALQILQAQSDSLHTLLFNLNAPFFDTLAVDTLYTMSLDDPKFKPFFDSLGLLHAQIALTDSMIMAEKVAINTALAQRLSIADSLNSSIVAEHDFEQFEMDINEILISTLSTDSLQFTSLQRQTIEAIAAMCPLAGGVAVYKARSLLYFYNDTIWFDDEALCTPPSMRLAEKEQPTVPKQDGMKVYPNPSRGQLTVEFEQAAVHQVHIYNAIGQRVFTAQATEEMLNVDLNMLNISPGLLLIEAYNQENNKVFKSKIIYDK